MFGRLEIFFVYRVVSDLKLVSSAFDYKPFQLRGVLGTQLREGLWIINLPIGRFIWFLVEVAA